MDLLEVAILKGKCAYVLFVLMEIYRYLYPAKTICFNTC